MVRAAAKNHASVAIVTDGADYARALEAAQGGGFTLAEREQLAAKAFVHTATYDVAVASWMGNVLPTPPTAPASPPGRVRRGTGRRCCGTARTRTSPPRSRSEEHTSELQSLMRISYAVFCLKKKKDNIHL